MATTSDDDPQQRFALGVVFIVIGLLLSTVLGAVVYRFAGETAQTVATGAAATSAGTVVGAVTPGATTAVVSETTVAVASESSTAVSEAATVQVVDGVVKFFFATGSADIAPGAAEALAQVIQGVASGRQAVVSGFHDPTGDRAVNEALARRRAESVRDMLVNLGVPADRIRLEKPAETTGSGVNALARRVEVMLVD